MDRRLLKPLIVHISADFPDACQPRKTRAIAALVEGSTDSFDHRVYSLNRFGGGLRALLAPGAVTTHADDGRVATWRYAAPGKGLLLAASMRRVGAAVAADLRARGLRPALIQGHKLSFEGIAARHAANVLGVPYALTLQGNTDQKVLSARPDLRRLYRRVWREAAVTFAFAPWIARWCEERLGTAGGIVAPLPCVPAADRVIAPRETGPRVITAFHLEHWRNKNVETLARACALLATEVPGLGLDVAGQGDEDAERSVDAVLAQANASSFARRLGHVDGASVQDWMNEGAVFVLPSRRETFGMVFIEALLAGCPIIYPRGAAVDGYFDGCAFALGVDARDPRALADTIATMLRENGARKAALAAWQANGGARRFRRSGILADYIAGLRAVLPGDA